MSNKDINEFVNDIPEISERNYWMVRTNGGAYFEDFVEKGFIGINYNKINLSQIESVKTAGQTGRNSLEEIVKKAYPLEQRPGYISNQLWDFTFNLRKGDVILIPGVSGDRVAIGEVISSKVFNYESSDADGIDACPYVKRKGVNWIKTDLSFGGIDPHLLHFKYTRRTITSFDAYSASLIDRELKILYVKNDKAHLALSIGTEENIPAVSLFEFWVGLLDATEDFCKENDIPFDKKEIDVRINVQSPGIVELITGAMAGLFVLTGLMCTVIGADYETEIGKAKMKFKTGGLLRAISDYKNNSAKRKLINTLNDKAKQIGFDKKEITKLIEQINKNNENL